MLLEETGAALHSQAIGRKDREILRKRKVLEAKIASLNSEYESVEEELNKVYLEEELKKQILATSREEVIRLRKGEAADNDKKEGKK
jgi:circadian clock protein KaiC